MNKQSVDSSGPSKDPEKPSSEELPIPSSRQLGLLSWRAVLSIRLAACRSFAWGSLYTFVVCLFLVGYSYVWGVNHMLAFIYFLLAVVLIVIFARAGYLAFSDGVRQWKGSTFLKRQLDKVRKSLKRMEEKMG